MIDYNKIGYSIEYYSENGFNRVEAPWWVSKEISEITKPPNINDYYIQLNKKCLVGSGEQSFLYMASKGRLPKGRYQCTTPCFREESIGLLNKKCFIKTELIQTQITTLSELEEIVDISLNFFSKFIIRSHLSVIETVEGFDITAKGMELGSYGIRSHLYLDWIYATGCAEPRLSRIIKILN